MVESVAYDAEAQPSDSISRIIHVMHSREEKVSWVDHEAEPPAHLLTRATSYGACPGTNGTMLHTTHVFTSINSRRERRRQRWRAVLVSIGGILGLACLLIVVILMIGKGKEDGNGMNDPDFYDESADGDEGSISRKRREGKSNTYMAENDRNVVTNLPFFGDLISSMDDIFRSPLLDATSTDSASPASVAPDPSPDYPTSAPQDPNIHIPVSMGCLEAQCESWMAALGKDSDDNQNIMLLDCIQRTGMSVSDSHVCFKNGNITGSPLRLGLYQCAICKECLTAESQEEKDKWCKNYKASARSSSSGNSSSSGGGTPAPSASAWQQYVPHSYIPSFSGIGLKLWWRRQ